MPGKIAVNGKNVLNCIDYAGCVSLIRQVRGMQKGLYYL